MPLLLMFTQFYAYARLWWWWWWQRRRRRQGAEELRTDMAMLASIASFLPS
jgi:hypothetical protein